jgi:DNA-binding response OmpR family regulator
MIEAPLRVLIVDDEDDVRWLLAEVVETRGYRVASVDNYARAVMVLEHEPLTLVIADLRLRGRGSGSDLAVLARSLGVPSLIISGIAEPLDGLVADGFPVLRKPFHMHEFEAKLDELLVAA